MDHHHRPELQGCDCGAVDGSHRRVDPDDQPSVYLSAEATTTEIDGFLGQPITADHAEYDTARAVWNGAVDASGW